jgi:hypothetical protein
MCGMNLRHALAPVVLLALTCSLRAVDTGPVPKLPDPAEQKAWEAIAARFEGAPTLKSTNSKTLEIAVEGLKGDPKKGGSASITVDVAGGGHVVGVTSNGARFTDDEFELFAPFKELNTLTLWHNAPSSGVGLKHLMGLPKLSKLTLAGGGLNDDGMAVAAKLPALKSLRAWHCKFGDAGIAAFREHPMLEEIAVGAMWDQLFSDKTIEALSTCPKLQKVQIAETRLSWDGGLSHLLARKRTLKSVDLGNCIVEASDVERLRKGLPDAKVEWKGLGAAGTDFQKSWTRGKAEKWIPKELIEKAIAEAPAPSPAAPK